MRLKNSYPNSENWQGIGYPGTDYVFYMKKYEER